VVTPEGIAAIEAVMKENRRVTANEIAAHRDMSHGSAQRIVSFHFIYSAFLRSTKVDIELVSITVGTVQSES
jgi:hypothetical protein